MLDNILLAVDGSDHSERAAEFAASLAEKVGSRLTVIHVLPTAPPVPRGIEEWERMEQIHLTQTEILRSVAAEMILFARKAAANHGINDVETVITIGRAAREIVEYAEAIGADAIVMGRRGHGDVGGLLLGSVSHRVGHLADTTVITVR